MLRPRWYGRAEMIQRPLLRPRRTGYRERLGALAAVRAIRPGELIIAHVSHDDWCPLLRGESGECTCEPDIVLDRVHDRGRAS